MTSTSLTATMDGVVQVPKGLLEALRRILEDAGHPTEDGPAGLCLDGISLIEDEQPVRCLIEVWQPRGTRPPRNGKAIATLTLGDERLGYRLAGPKVGGGSLLHQFPVDGDELIREAIIRRVAGARKAKDVG